MSMKLYVGNLPWSVTSSELEDELRSLGLVFTVAEVVFDRDTERSRGFAFVHFDHDEAAEVAREKLDGLVLGGRTLVANMATSERREKSRGEGGYSRSREGRDPRGGAAPRRDRGGRGRAAGSRRGRDDWGGF